MNIQRKIINDFVLIIGFTEASWSGYKWLNGVEVVLGKITIGPEEWFAFTVFGILVTIFAGYYFLKIPYLWIKSLIPTNRFKSLANEIQDYRLTFQNHIKYINNSPNPDDIINRKSLIIKLAQLKIDSPRLGDDNQRWLIFLLQIETYSKFGNLKEARNILKDNNKMNTNV